MHATPCKTVEPSEPPEPAAKDSQARKMEERVETPVFDPRTEVSADARYISGRIVKHLWILFVLLPFTIILLLAISGTLK